MGRFLEAEKKRLAYFKAASPFFSMAARAPGIYDGKPREFCLPYECAEENLFPGIRQAITAYFAEKEIKWHDGQGRRPSNHLCDSQVCCANFLFPFADKPYALAELLRPVFPAIREMLPIEGSQFVACEWIGEKNYLGEKISRNGKRTRGANCTSADAAVMFDREDGLRQVVLVEWKYTESYGSTSLKIAARSGTDRTAIYRPLFNRDDCPLNKDLLPCFAALFYEPFYQLMRQQFLAHEMERAHELGADIVSLLHIAPAHNGDFRRVTSPDLRNAGLGESVMDIWKNLVRIPDRFRSISTEELFGSLPVMNFPELAAWWEYVTTRHTWVRRGNET
ncbi:MAG: hypothetical protein IT330_12660 [Anaerolineae bacterium]|nr:hypothetical protein [Anaerolineae bacterium]